MFGSVCTVPVGVRKRWQSLEAAKVLSAWKGGRVWNSQVLNKTLRWWCWEHFTKPVSHSSKTSKEPNIWHLQICANQEWIIFYLLLILLLSVWVCDISQSLMSQIQNEWIFFFSGWWIVETTLDTRSWFLLGWDLGHLMKFAKINQESSELLEKQPCLRKQKKQSLAGKKLAKF